MGNKGTGKRVNMERFQQGNRVTVKQAKPPQNDLIWHPDKLWKRGDGKTRE